MSGARPRTLARRAAAAAPRLPLERLAWAAACLALALVALAATLPGWILITIAAAAAIRLGAAARGGDAPPAAPRAIVAVFAIGALLVQFHTVNGLAAGTALLALTGGLKLLETRTRRDLYVIILIVYFLCLAALLAGESFWLLAYLLGVCWLTTAAALHLAALPGGPAARASLRYAARAIGYAAPIALALWLFFPRFAGPLWRLGGEARGASSGLGDTLSPGDIDDLAMSDDIAFRVRFLGAAPPRRDLYWRGPVLDDFDGRTWRRDDRSAMAAPPALAGGATYRYRVSLEPYPHRWIYALDWPLKSTLAGAFLSGDDVLMRRLPMTGPVDVVASSRMPLLAQPILGAGARRRDSALPAGSNPRTRNLAEALRRAHPADLSLIEAVLAMFHREAFFYTLTPPPLGRNSIDEFLFDTKRGFCGHYASAFAVLMRAAGIPARVVTGYLDGTFNPYADYWIVRQSDAHAWDEVWIDGRGWLRVDPTAAIAPQRIDPGLREGSLAGGSLALALRRDAPWFADLTLRIDALRLLWRERVLRYDRGAQFALLARLRIGAPDSQKLLFALAAAMALCFAWLSWQLRRALAPRRRRDALTRNFEILAAKLAAVGLVRRPPEGAEAYAERVAAARPDLAATVTRLCRQYSALRYGRERERAAAARGLAGFREAVRAFRPKKSRGS
ncbi:MAG TPA: DUF3488 and transglutaminase-like domain-containing protein [Steroidobacteraceae bacterium]|nr:DUF3488 and transglutaminase-like domain-containing protein [Steroidobacteraceae bacterium]